MKNKARCKRVSIAEIRSRGRCELCKGKKKRGFTWQLLMKKISRRGRMQWRGAVKYLADIKLQQFVGIIRGAMNLANFLFFFFNVVLLFSFSPGSLSDGLYTFSIFFQPPPPFARYPFSIIPFAPPRCEANFTFAPILEKAS